MSLAKKRLSRGIAAAGLSLSLAGCGLVYENPGVGRRLDDGSKVKVVQITPASLPVANDTPYMPRQLPAAFSQTALNAKPGAGLHKLPSGVLAPVPGPARLPTRLPPVVQPGPYRIGVGDVLLLATPAGTTVAELSGLLAAQNSRQGYTVQDDGAIAIPNVGRVQVAGKTVQDAEAAVFQALAAQNISPTFSLEISTFGSQRVAVGGAVMKPTVEPITLQPLHLDEALSAAGGIRPGDRATTMIRLYRQGQIYQIPLDTYYAQSRLQHLPLLAGDSVFVDTQYDPTLAQAYFSQQAAEIGLRRDALDERRKTFQDRLQMGAVKQDYVYLTGEVGAQTRYALPFGQTASLADALYGDAKGVQTSTGNLAQLYVLRAGPGPDGIGQITAWHLNAKNVANIVLATRFQLRPDDVIFVSPQPITAWNRVVSQILPSLSATYTASKSGL